MIKEEVNLNEIQKLRNESKLSQRQFAEYFDIPLRTLQDWEQGRRKPPEYVIKMMEKLFKIEH